jgi:hypothetical protein
VLPIEPERSPVPVLTTEFDEHTPMFSPDGRWLAYVSNESGREEVYIQPYPSLNTKHVISSEGGRFPAWSADGSVYYDGHQLLAVAIDTQPRFSAGTPQPLFETENPSASMAMFYDIAPDGRFLVAKAARDSEPIRFHVVLNWTEELKRLVPAN